MRKISITKAMLEKRQVNSIAGHFNLTPQFDF
jgi:hypothetical protein